MADEGLTFEDLLAELTAGLRGEEGITASEALAEIRKRQGRRRTIAWVRARLKIMLDEGRLYRGWGMRVSLDGTERSVPVYRLKAQEARPAAAKPPQGKKEHTGGYHGATAKSET
jgi:hypothetical protein